MKSSLHRLLGKYNVGVDDAKAMGKHASEKAAYARGGRVRYAEGGQVDPVGVIPGPGSDEGSFVSQPLTVSPGAPAPAAAAVPPRSQNLEALLSKYTAPSGEYTRELAAARQAARTETEAFSNMIRQMAERGESPTSRAEMYFRLASAFGSPTKTGQFTENLALAGKEMGEYAKGRRADEAERRGLALKAQEMRMAGARQDLATTQALAAQEGSERRAMAREVIKEYIASGRPQSDAGKMAQDAGLVPGTPEYNEFVDRYIKTKMESGDLYRQAMLAIQEGNLELRRMAEARKQEAEKQLSPQELKLRETTEDELSGVNQAIRGLTRALEINERAFGNSAVEAAQYRALQLAGRENEKVVNTTELRNILGRAAISNLKATFGGAPTEGERNALMELEGALSKTPAERRRIIENSLAELRRSADTRKRRLDDIVSGRYRQRTETAPGSSGDNQ